MGSHAGGALLLLRKMDPKDVKAGIIGTGILFGLIGAGWTGYTAYEAFWPSSRTNALQTRQEVAIEDCVQNKPATLKSSFDERFYHSDAAVPTNIVVVNIKDKRVVLSRVTGTDNLQNQTIGGTANNAVTRSYVSIYSIQADLTDGPAGVQKGYYDGYKVGKDYHRDWHPTDYFPKDSLPVPDREMLGHLRQCSQSFLMTPTRS